MATTSEITQSIITQARLIDPNMSLEVGTPERKIVEAVAEAIATASVDIEVLSGQLYLDELAGSRIDSFVSLFGFGRQVGTRATGIVTVSRSAVTNFDSIIRKGTQFSTSRFENVPSLVFVATETVTLRANEVRALVRVECTTTGTIGNLPARAINAITNSVNIPGVTAVVNEVPTGGGVDTENDAQLKARFQNTIFRNMAGTNDQYLALSLSHPAVSKANVIGPQSRYVEYIQVPSDPDATPHPNSSEATAYTTSLSSVPYSKYTYTNNYYVAKGVGKNAKFLKPGLDYAINVSPARDAGGSLDSIPVGNIVPNITFLGESAVVDGLNIPFAENVFLFEHNYMSKASRNDWRNGIYNCVDVYVNGEQNQPASSEEYFPSATTRFVDNPAMPTHRANFVRKLTGQLPAVTSRLQTLYHQPALELQLSSVFVNGGEYLEAKYTAPNGMSYTTMVYEKTPGMGDYYQDKGTWEIAGELGHYFFVEDVSVHRGTIRARNGIEWLENSITADTEGFSFNVSYSYNIAIKQLQAVIERAKQITTDVLVHSSDFKYMRLYITIMYTPGFTEENVNRNIVDSVNALFGLQYYGSVIQMSDILQAVHNTNGVDNVRWTYEDPVDHPTYPGHKIELVTKNGSSFSDRVFYDSDFILNDDELPALADTEDYTAIANALVVDVRAQNTWERPKSPGR
jgi:hypothetical protein